MSNVDPLPGFRDFYPEDCQIRNYIFDIWRMVCRRHNFVEYDAPILQPTELFIEKSGPEIVGQLFNFKDKGGREVTLRPEMTPYVCQMIAAKAQSLKRPLRWFSIGEFFRYERPQKGRLRSFFQLNADIFDEAGVAAEVELLALAVDLCRGFGLTQKDIAVRLSDRTLWLEYLSAKGLSPETATGVLQIVDKWEREDPAEITKKLEALKQGLAEAVNGLIKIKSFAELEKFLGAQASLGNSPALAARLADWKSLLADLTALGLSDFIQVDLGIVRGLAYYTGFVFEVFEKTGKSRALGGGGRYDNLVEKIGGPKMPAMGWACGDVTLLDCLTERGLLPKFIQSCNLFLVYTSDTTRAKALELLPQLRAAGLCVEISLKPIGFGKQMKAADKAGARYACIIGDDELAKGLCKLKCLNSGDELEVPLGKLLEHLKGK